MRGSGQVTVARPRSPCPCAGEIGKQSLAPRQWTAPGRPSRTAVALNRQHDWPRRRVLFLVGDGCRRRPFGRSVAARRCPGVCVRRRVQPSRRGAGAGLGDGDLRVNPLTPARPPQTWPRRYSASQRASPTSSSWTRRRCPSSPPHSASLRCWSWAARVRGSPPPRAPLAPGPRPHLCHSVLERLDSNRQQMPEVQAIYFLDPNERSFARMLKVRRRRSCAADRRRTLTQWALQDFRELEGDVSQVGCCERMLYFGMRLPKVSVRMYKSVHLVTTRRTACPAPVHASWPRSSRPSPHAPRASAV